MSIPPNTWTPAPSALLFYFLPSSLICKWYFGGWGQRRGGRGRGPAGRGVGALSPSVTPPSPPLRRGCGSAAERAAEGRALGDAGVRGSGLAARHTEHAGRLSSAWSPEHGARSRPPPASCALGGSPGRGSPAPGERAPPWSLRTKTPRRRQRRRRWLRWRRRTGGRPRPAVWWCRSARRRAPCAPPSPTCPSPWPSSVSSSTLSCLDWVRRGGRDPCAPGTGAGGRQGRRRGGTLGRQPRAACAAPALPAPSGRWQKRLEWATGGRRGEGLLTHLSPSPTWEPGDTGPKSQKLCRECWITRAAARAALSALARFPSRRPQILSFPSAALAPLRAPVSEGRGPPAGRALGPRVGVTKVSGIREVCRAMEKRGEPG